MRSVVWAAAAPLNKTSAVIAAAAVKARFMMVSRFSPQRRRPGPLAPDSSNPTVGAPVHRLECGNKPVEDRRAVLFRRNRRGSGKLGPAMTRDGVAAAVIGKGRPLGPAALDREWTAGIEMAA